MALPNFFKSYFYGHSGKQDFTEADLPENRLQLFRDVLSVRRGSMVSVNFLYLLFWLPAICWGLLNLIQLYHSIFMTDDTLPQIVDSIIYSWLLLNWPLVAITGPFNMGVSYVLRNWARDEHSFILGDFSAALKANWKQGLIYGVISGAVPLISYICGDFYLDMAETSAAFYMPMAIALIAAILWYLCAPILPTMIVTYRQGFFALLKNAVLMTLAELPKAILIKLATLVVPLLVIMIALLFPSTLGWAIALAAVLYALFMPVFNKLIYAGWANALCEKYLNPKIEGARVDIGLRPKEDKK